MQLGYQAKGWLTCTKAEPVWNGLDNAELLARASTRPCSVAGHCVSSQAANNDEVNVKPAIGGHCHWFHVTASHEQRSSIAAHLSAGEDSAWCAKQLRLGEVCAETVTA